MTESRDATGARVQELCLRANEWIKPLIVATDFIPECQIAGGCPVGFNPLMFIRRDPLLRELPSNPIGLLGENNFLIHSQRRQCCGTSSRSPSNDRYVCFPFAMKLGQRQ